MSDNIQDNKFKEELEKELQSGFHSSSDGGSGDDDFTVKVKREEYIVKRRFYDKDKALEEAETLRKDKRNLVEDNIEGQAFSIDDDGDEVIDWDKLVDAGLEFDPPIAQAAEKKPGEPPVGLAEEVAKPRIDDQVLEKTLLVKRPKKEVPQAAEPDENVEFEGEEVQDEAVEKKSKLLWIILLFLVVCAGAGAYFALTNKSQPVKPPSFKIESTPKTAKAPIPARPAASPADEAVTETPVPAEKKTPALKEPTREALPPELSKRPLPAQKPAPVAAEAKPVQPVKQPEPPASKKTAPVVEDHFTHTVHVSSYKNRDRALSAVFQLKKKGYEAFAGTISIPGKGQWHRVYAGYLKDLDSAVQLSDQIKKETREDAVARKTPTAIQVGDTALLTDLKATLSKLDQKGYAANAVPLAPGSDMGRILTGAFKHDKEAATMLSNLKKDGFSAKTVLR